MIQLLLGIDVVPKIEGNYYSSILDKYLNSQKNTFADFASLNIHPLPGINVSITQDFREN